MESLTRRGFGLTGMGAALAALSESEKLRLRRNQYHA
jgi:hypothetical protein